MYILSLFFCRFVRGENTDGVCAPSLLKGLLNAGALHITHFASSLRPETEEKDEETVARHFALAYEIYSECANKHDSKEAWMRMASLLRAGKGIARDLEAAERIEKMVEGRE